MGVRGVVSLGGGGGGPPLVAVPNWWGNTCLYSNNGKLSGGGGGGGGRGMNPRVQNAALYPMSRVGWARCRGKKGGGGVGVQELQLHVHHQKD